MTTRDINQLVKIFKDLILQDISVGITATDARNAVAEWLELIGEPELSDMFSEKVFKYQTSKKVEKLIEDYENDN